MDWFKMQTVWGSSIERMTDAEAGRFIKAVYAFVRYGEEYNGNGKEEMLVWQALDILRMDLAKFADAQAEADNARRAKSEEMRKLARRRWDMRSDAERMPTDANRMRNDAGRMRKDAERMRSDAYKNKNKKETEGEENNPLPSDSLETDEALIAIQADHEEIFNAMEYAGFDLDNATMDMVVGLYAQYGKEKMLKAVNACVENSVKKIVYMRGVLESMSKEEQAQSEKPKKKEDEVRWF